MALVQTGALIQPVEFPQRVFAIVDLDAFGIDVGYVAGPFGPQDHATVSSDVCLQTHGDDGRFGNQQRHGLALHVGTHQGAVGVVVFQERNQTGRDADHLFR